MNRPSGRRHHPHPPSAPRLALLYILLGGLWILASDTLVHHVSHTAGLWLEMQTQTGLGFISLTGLLIYGWLRERDHAFTRLYDELDALLEDSPDLICRFREDGTITRVNRALCTWFAREREELEGRKLYEFIPREELPAMRTRLAALRPDMAPQEVSSPILRSDGSIRWTTWRCRAVRTNDGITEYEATGRDITEAREMQLRLREQELQLRLLVDEIVDYGVAMLDLEGRIQTWNAGAEAMYGHSAAEMVGCSQDRLFPFDLIEPQLPQRLLEAAARDGRSFTESWQVRADGSPFLARMDFFPLKDASGALRGYCRSCRDVTREREAGDALRRAEQRWQFATEMAGDGLWDYDGRTRTMYFSPRWRQLFGNGDQPESPALDTWTECIHPLDRERVASEVNRHIAGETPFFESEHRVRRPDGVYRWTLARGKVVERDQDGTPLRLLGTMLDISRLKEAEEELHLAAEVIEHSQEAILITDAEQRIVYVNPAFTAVTGYTADEAVGQTPRILNSKRQPPAFFQQMWSSLRERGVWQGEVWNRRKDGKIYPEWQIISAVTNERGEVRNYIAIFRDLSETRQTTERLEFLEKYDALTGLPNRELALERLEAATCEADAHSSGGAVLFVDLDRFKHINESLGHSAGDSLLQIMGRRLREHIRHGDTVARLGADEYLVILPGLKSAADAQQIALHLMEIVCQPVELEGRELSLSPSVGIALFPQHGRRADQLLRCAEAAVHAAKQRGRRTCLYYTPDMATRAMETLALENDLRRALERGELFVEYQPQMDLSTGAIIGAEALVRWRHPERGIISPAVFIPLAEERGLIDRLGDQVLEIACRQNRAWIDQGLTPRPVAVNISALQFRRPDFTQRVEQVLRETGLPPQWLELELTEGALIQEVEESRAAMRRLADQGVQLSIDDFGTGYSSLSYLRRFPLQKLKIDQSFARDLGRRPDAEAISSAIIKLAHSLGLKAIAEGVEEPAQLELLRHLGCDEIQGYHLSRPLSADRYEAFLKARSSS